MPPDNATEPPNKRRKVGHSYTPDSGNAASPSIKQEPSPSPPPPSALQTSGTTRISLPHACQKTNVDWKERRAEWVKEETTKLKESGVQVTKRFLRDDGLAIDWISPVPIDPYTLRAPSPKVQPVHEQPIPTSFRPIDRPLDPLGHALRDQSSLAGLPVSDTLHTVPAPTSSLKPEAVVRTSATENVSSAPPDFVVVGAALRKRAHSPGRDTDGVTAPSEPVQSEHRKLFPADFRKPPGITGSREALKDWRARRKAWIMKEIEKVEGYTGEQSRGFKYDGDDVIIFLQTRRKNNTNNRERDSRKHLALPPVNGTQSEHLTLPPGNGTQSEHPALPPVNGTQFAAADTNVDVDSVRSNPPVVSQGISGEKSTERTAETPRNITANLRGTADDANMPPQSRNAEGTRVVDLALNLVPQTVTPPSAPGEPDTNDVLNATKAHGLAFLEQYLQIFDNDRGKLGVAYTVNATLSLQTEEGYCNLRNASKVPSRSPTSDIIQVINTGPTEIVRTLQQLTAHLHHSPLSEIVYNIAALDDMLSGALLLTCDGVMVHPDHPEQAPEWSFSRTFVLKLNLEESRTIWPMTIVAERLTICSISGSQC